MFVTGPDVIKTVTHEEVTKDALGGAATHNEISGVAHFMAHDDAECLAMVRELLSFLPSNNLDDPPRKECTRPGGSRGCELDKLVPTESEPAVRHQGRDHAHCGRWVFLRGARALREEHCGGICADERAAGGDCGESAGVSCGGAGYQCQREGGAVCAVLRCVQYSADYA